MVQLFVSLWALIGLSALKSDRRLAGPPPHNFTLNNAERA